MAAATLSVGVLLAILEAAPEIRVPFRVDSHPSSKLGGKSQGGRRDRNQPYRESRQRERITLDRTLHLLDSQKTVEFSQYLRLLCGDLSDLLFQDAENSYSITVEGPEIEIGTTIAIPLGFIVNELVTNAAKYAYGDIIVKIGGTPAAGYSLSVQDDGPGLPPEFDPARCKGLGMKIVLALVKQIQGRLKIVPSETGRGTKLAVTF